MKLPNKKINPKFKTKIIDKLICKYCNKNEIEKGNLIWNSFKKSPKIVLYEDIKNLNIPNNDLFFFLERENELYKVNLDQVLLFLESLEPWEDIDAYLFDETFNWIIAITHEDLLLTFGIN